MNKVILIALILFALPVFGQQQTDTSDFIEGSFEINSIEKQKDVYIILASSNGHQYKIASPVSFKPRDSRRIKVGNTYELVLYSYMTGNYFHIGSLEVSPNNIITVGDDLDLYKALNLKGVFVLSPKNIDKSVVVRKVPLIVEKNMRIDKIKRFKKVYIIYASAQDTIYKIVSPIYDYNRDHQKIKKKQYYNLILYSCKDEDNRSENKLEIIPKTYIRIDRKTGQLYESPVLYGRYYVPLLNL